MGIVFALIFTTFFNDIAGLSLGWENYSQTVNLVYAKLCLFFKTFGYCADFKDN